MAGTPSLPMGTTGAGKTKHELEMDYAQTVAKNADLLQKGQSINASRNSSAAVAAATTALSNQTGGNVMGFTYE